MELETLFNKGVLYDTLLLVMCEDVPFGDTLSHWSSRTFEHYTNSVCIVMFNGAYVLNYYRSNYNHVRCVRGRRGDE